jgi:biopolymer transport protein TolQ
MNNSALQLVLEAGYVVKGVLLLLLFFSVMSWAIIFFKQRYFTRANKESEQFLRLYRSNKNVRDLYKASKNMNLSPLTNLFKSVYADEVSKDPGEVRRLLRRYGTLESVKLERYLNFLATTGSTSPFIGLFGTVWGIMTSFHGIGTAGTASLAIVAPGIAEALIATAVGLVAAIPAVIAYNYYLSMARKMIIDMEDFSEDLLELFTRAGAAE